MIGNVQRLASLWAAALLATVLTSAQIDDVHYDLTIPLELEVNGSSQGEIIVQANASLDRIAIEGSSLKEILRERAAESNLPFVESLPNDFTPLEDLRSAGLEVFLNLERLVVEVSIQGKSQQSVSGPQTISLTYRGHQYDREPIPEARFSGYVNARWTGQISEQDSQSEGSNVHNRIAFDHLLNVNGWALMGRSSLRDDAAKGTPAFAIHDLRVVKDFPQRALRLAFGDISTPISSFQQGFSLFGASLSREFGLQPSRIFNPTGSTNFQLSEQSVVEIYLNGAIRKSLKLDPGEYNIEEFKLIAGANNLDIRIRGESGREEQVSLTRFASSELLGRNVASYALSFGLPTANSFTEDPLEFSLGSFYERTLDPNPVVSGFYARGLTDTLTLEGNFQGRSNWARAALSTSWINRYGAFMVAGSANALEDHDLGAAARFAWRRQLWGTQLRAETSYANKTAYLSQPEQSVPADSIMTNTSMGLSRRFGDRWDAALTGFHQVRHSGRQDYAVSTQIGRRFGEFHASLNLKLRTQKERHESSAFIRMSWTPSQRWNVRSQVGGGDPGAYSGNHVTINYNQRRARSYVGSNLRIQGNSEQRTLYGELRYQTELFDASLAREQIYASIADFDVSTSRYTLTANSAVAFADGAFGFARQVGNSFALIANHPKWKGTTLGINPGLGGYRHTTDGRGPSPVLTDLNSYRPSVAVIHTVDSDYFLESNEFLFLPSSHRGTKLVVGSDAIYTLRSTLIDSYGDALGFKNIALTNQDGERLSTFTNKAGRFIVSGLSEGHWTISISNLSETAEVDISGEDNFLFLKQIQTY